MLPEHCDLFNLVMSGYGRLGASPPGLNPGGRELIATGYGRLGASPQDSYPGAGVGYIRVQAERNRGCSKGVL